MARNLLIGLNFLFFFGFNVIQSALGNNNPSSYNFVWYQEMFGQKEIPPKYASILADVLKDLNLFNRSSEDRLVFSGFNRSLTGDHLRFTHRHYDVPVWNSYLIIHISSDFKVNLRNEIKAVDCTKQIIVNEPNTVLFSISGCYVQGTCQILSSAQELSFVIQSENKGTLFYRDCRVYYRDTVVNTNVFYPNPIVSSKSEYGGFLIDNLDQTNAYLNSQMTTVGIPVKISSNGNIILESESIKFGQVSLPYMLLDSIHVADLDADRSDLIFEYLNVFFHLANYQQYAKDFGFENIIKKVLVDPHALHGKDQSAFNPYNNPPTLEFGIGGVDDGEDAQVIIHEFAHSLVYNASSFSYSNSIERIGLEEGISDYLAMSYSNKLSKNISHEVFSWDGHNEFWDGYKVGINGLSYQALHSVDDFRQFSSGMLMCMADKLGSSFADSLVLESIYYLEPSSSIVSYAKVLLEIDSIWNYKGIETIRSCLISNGVISPTRDDYQNIIQDRFQIVLLNNSVLTNELIFSVGIPAAFDVYMYDMNGHLISDYLFNIEFLSISTEGLAPGMYLICVVFRRNNTMIPDEKFKVVL